MLRLGILSAVLVTVLAVGALAFYKFQDALAQLKAESPSLSRIEKLEEKDLYINERIDTLYEIIRERK
jgi:hypothetical protein